MRLGARLQWLDCKQRIRRDAGTKLQKQMLTLLYLFRDPSFPGCEIQTWGWPPPARFDTRRPNTDTDWSRCSCLQPRLPMDWLAVWGSLFGRQSGRLLGRAKIVKNQHQLGFWRAQGFSEGRKSALYFRNFIERCRAVEHHGHLVCPCVRHHEVQLVVKEFLLWRGGLGYNKN